jgi:hypothetical protein
MTPAAFSVRTTSRYDRLSNRLQKSHRDFDAVEKSAAAILSDDPYNRTRRHHIKKLEGVAQGEGQYRLSLGRWRFVTTSLANLFGCITAACAERIRIERRHNLLHVAPFRHVVMSKIPINLRLSRIAPHCHRIAPHCRISLAKNAKVAKEPPRKRGSLLSSVPVFFAVPMRSLGEECVLRTVIYLLCTKENAVAQQIVESILSRVSDSMVSLRPPSIGPTKKPRIDIRGWRTAP